MLNKNNLIYSKLQPSTIIGLVFRTKDFEGGRTDIAPINEFLQCSALILEKDKSFRPHKHISLEKTTNVTQEAWVVMHGSIEVTWYDVDDTILTQRILKQGDMALTFRGGHTFRVIDNKTLIYEFKTGPYWGQELDKVFING